MYISSASTERDDYARFQGFAEDTLGSQQFEKSLADIKATLQRSPKDGYTKGSAPRKQLETAFESVPRSFAVELANQLLTKDSSLAKLFRYRLHPATQKALLEILVRKAKELLQQEKEELRTKEAEVRRRHLETSQNIEQIRQKICASLQVENTLVEEICKRTGENSAQCQTLRANAVKAREEIRVKGFRCP
jgi:hypothetical protein